MTPPEVGDKVFLMGREWGGFYIVYVGAGREGIDVKKKKKEKKKIKKRKYPTICHPLQIHETSVRAPGRLLCQGSGGGLPWALLEGPVQGRLALWV